MEEKKEVIIMVYRLVKLWGIVGTPKDSKSERIIWKDHTREKYWWYTYQGGPMIFSSHQKAYAELKKVKMKTCKKPRMVKIEAIWKEK